MRTRTLAFLATDWNIDTTLFSYDSDGRIDLITRPNGMTSDYSYDPAGRLDRIDHSGPGGVIDFFDYDYDRQGIGGR